MPVLRQLFINIRKRRATHHSHSSEAPFREGDNTNGSPLHPSVEDVESDYIPSLSSPVSNFERKDGSKLEIDSENKSSPTFSIASRLGRMSLMAEKERGSEDSRNATASKCSRQREEKRDKLLTLGNPAMLGYKCEIEGGSPKPSP